MTWSEVLPTAIAATPSIVVAIVNLLVLNRNQRKQLQQNENRLEVDSISKQLTDFYYPYTILAKENTALYRVFSEPHLKANPDFRTLIELLNDKAFSPNDSAFIKKIIENDKKLNDLISLKGYLVNDEALKDLLVRSSTHYSIISMAFDKEVTGEAERFVSYVHPNEVFERVEKERISLEKRIEALKNA